MSKDIRITNFDDIKMSIAYNTLIATTLRVGNATTTPTNDPGWLGRVFISRMRGRFCAPKKSITSVFCASRAVSLSFCFRLLLQSYLKRLCHRWM